MGCYRRLINDAFRRYNRNVQSFSFSCRCDPMRSRISSQPIFRNIVINNNPRTNPFFDGAAKRFYNAAADRYRRFRRRYQIQRILSFLSVNGIAISVIYCWNLETVPYTKRRHFVLMSNSLEKKIGDLMFELLCRYDYEWIILASHDPASIRVKKIGQDIMKGLKKWEDDEHLEEFKCEFFVVEDPTEINPVWFPGGKIVVSTGLLNHLKTDAEIATVIAHGVGHLVARHAAELLSGSLLLYYLQFSSLPERHEREADYIGMLISASAGYDPRITTEAYRKIGELFGNYERVEILSQPKVMDEALAIYREALNDKDRENEGK